MRALIVDDSRFLRERLKGVLGPMGWTFAEAENGQAALDLLEIDNSFELILLDVNMPQMNGMECVRKLRYNELAPATKVMMVTTEADSSFISDALLFGADEFLMKPFTAEGLSGKLLMLGLVDTQAKVA